MAAASLNTILQFPLPERNSAALVAYTGRSSDREEKFAFVLASCGSGLLGNLPTAHRFQLALHCGAMHNILLLWGIQTILMKFVVFVMQYARPTIHCCSASTSNTTTVPDTMDRGANN
uniref:Uncharacterized protein n=1 Tax=Anopheles culicifacies TaxID=139723 RepID=A0A182M842_9DIPT